MQERYLHWRVLFAGLSHLRLTGGISVGTMDIC